MIAWLVPDVLGRKHQSRNPTPAKAHGNSRNKPSKSPPTARLLAGTAVAVITVLAVCTWVQIGYWRDNDSLYKRAIDAVPGNYFAQHEYGVLMIKAGLWNEGAVSPG